MKIKDNTGAEVSEAKCISAFFRQPSETVMDMHRQIRELTPESKTELAVGAAKELGWSVEP